MCISLMNSMQTNINCSVFHSGIIFAIQKLKFTFLMKQVKLKFVALSVAFICTSIQLNAQDKTPPAKQETTIPDFKVADSFCLDTDTPLIEWKVLPKKMTFTLTNRWGVEIITTQDPLFTPSKGFTEKPASMNPDNIVNYKLSYTNEKGETIEKAGSLVYFGGSCKK
jgi:hypothetical protein